MSRRSMDESSILPDTGPTQILPFLYLGCQDDALSTQTMQDNRITHVINVSTTGERPSFLSEDDEEHFFRIPIDDSLTAELLPHLDKAYAFIEKARQNKGRVFIHCLAGISRSAALAIAYVMRYLNLSADDAYKYVKQRRSHISPNFNFLGQLFEYEHKLSSTSESTITSPPMARCVVHEASLHDCRRFVQVEGRSNTNTFSKQRASIPSRPTSFNFDISKLARPQP